MNARIPVVLAAVAAPLVAQSATAPQVVQTDPIECGGPSLNGTERVLPLGGRQFGITIEATTPPGVTQVALLDVAVLCAPCTQLLSECSLYDSFHPLASYAFPTGAVFSHTQPLPLAGQLLNMPFALQFTRLVAPGTTGLGVRVPLGVTDFGPAHEVVLAGAPVARNSKVPSHISERDLYNESASRQEWRPFVANAATPPAGSLRAALLQEFLPGLPGGFLPAFSVQEVTLPNGAPLVLAADGTGMRPLAAPAVHAKVAALAALVQTRWGHIGYRLRMTSAKREYAPGNDASFHQYGRGCDLSLATANNQKLTVPGSAQPALLDRLARLAREAGFDWVWHEPGTVVATDHVHASVATGAPTVTIDCVSGGTLDAATGQYRWTVAVTANDPDGVWRIHAALTPTQGSGSSTPWLGAGSLRYDSDFPLTGPSETPLPTKTITFTVSSPSAAQTLHVWARDTFGGSPASATTQPVSSAPWVGPPPSAVTPDPALNMAWIPAGTFMMGSNEPFYAVPYFNDPHSAPAHPVTISRPFWIGRYEVTQAQYQARMGSNPSRFLGLSRPVDSVSWFDARAYCDLLTDHEAAAGRIPAGYHYRLPTEAEWEYCCRAGATTEFHTGALLDCGQAAIHVDLNQVCPFPWESVAVGSYAPNSFGLYDMHGNVVEWCLDSWDGSANYPAGSVTDPFVSSGPARVLRGGHSEDNWYACRSAARLGAFPSDYWGIGFRVVLAPVLCQ